MGPTGIDAIRISKYAFRYADQATIWQPERQTISKLRQLVSLRKSGPHRDYSMLRIPLESLWAKWPGRRALTFKTRSSKRKWKSLNKKCIEALEKEIIEVEKRDQRTHKEDDVLKHL